jgi:hypothetical protein
VIFDHNLFKNPKKVHSNIAKVNKTGSQVSNEYKNLEAVLNISMSNNSVAFEPQGFSLNESFYRNNSVQITKETSKIKGKSAYNSPPVKEEDISQSRSHM